MVWQVSQIMLVIYFSMTVLESTRAVHFFFISQVYQAEVHSEINKYIKSAIWTSTNQQTVLEEKTLENVKN